MTTREQRKAFSSGRVWGMTKALVKDYSQLGTQVWANKKNEHKASVQEMNKRKYMLQ